MNLIIVESPTKARTLSRFLGSDYRIEASFGHIRDLPKKELGVDVEHDFKPFYIIPPEKKIQAKELKKASEGVKQIFLATDPDREGEAIAWHVAIILGALPSPTEILMSASDSLAKDRMLLNETHRRSQCETSQNLVGSRAPLARIVFHEITKSAIEKALANPGEINLQLVDAQQARRVLDRLVGYKLSPLLWRKIRRGLSAGRVQSVAVRLIVEREREIEAFKPEEYWKIEAELQKVASFLATLISKNGQKIEIKERLEAEEIVKELEKATYKVSEIKAREVSKFPNPAFTTSTLQQSAAILLGWSAKRTMQIAQNLYEEGFITYHRTDSVNLAKEAIKETRDFILKNFGKEYLPSAPRIYKTKSKVAQEAHEAVRPTDVRQITNYKLQITNRDEQRLYELIWKRFVACQMREAIFEETKVDIEANKYLFRAVGRKLMFEGWKKVYLDRRPATLEGRENGEENTEKKLPPLEVDELLKLIKLLPSQHFTEPSPRYSEATLIKALEEKGIGRPSTYAPIISTIQERQYVEKIDPSTGSGQGKKFSPTPLGEGVNDFLVEHFPNIVDVGFTAKMEDDLDAIARGEEKWIPVIQQFYEPFAKQLEDVSAKTGRVKIKTEETEEICEKCGSRMVVRIGKFGKFLACSAFPRCDFTKPYFSKIGLKCPNCGGEIILKKTKKGKSFYGCLNYPTCNFAAWRKEQIIKNGAS